jgi:hypothetical protein
MERKAAAARIGNRKAFMGNAGRPAKKGRAAFDLLLLKSVLRRERFSH